MKRKVVIELDFDPAEYLGVNPSKDNDVKELVKAMIRGEADFPNGVAVNVTPRKSRRAKCLECGLMSDDPECCQNDEELWK